MYHQNGVLIQRCTGYILMLIIALLNGAAQAYHDDLSPASSPTSFPPHLPSTFPPASHALSLYPQDQEQYYGICDFECDVDCLMIHQLKRRLRVVGFVECYLDCMNKCLEQRRHSDTTKAAGILRNILGSCIDPLSLSLASQIQSKALALRNLKEN